MENDKHGPRAIEFPADSPACVDDDIFLAPWFEGVELQAGDFLKTMVQAARRADPQNYRTLRPVLLSFAKKYKEYYEVGFERRALEGRKHFPYGKPAVE